MEPLDYSRLLDDYFEGNTSLDEEKILKDYLKNYEGNNPDFIEAKTLFSFFDTEKEEYSSLDFDTIVRSKQTSKIRKIVVYAVSIAAAAVVIFSISYMFKMTGTPVVYAYINGVPITNQKVAMEYSKQAMKDLSMNLNKGTENLSCLSNLNKPAALLTAKKQ